MLLALLISMALLALWLLRRRALKIDSFERVSTMVVLGSGGHTSEMLRIVSKMDLDFYTPRMYVVADTDGHSAEKAHDFEQQSRGRAAKAEIITIHRSREVGQSFLTSIFTTARGLVDAIGIVWLSKPALVLVNGPGTCIPICIIIQICTTLMQLWSCKVVFFESIARVDSLSLSGKILYHCQMTDVFLVQWPELRQRYPRAQYAGRLY